MKLRKVNYRNKDSVKIIKYKGTYNDYDVSIIHSDDHDGWLFYVEKDNFNFNSMRKGILFSSKDETVMKAKEYIDNLPKSRRKK